MQLGKKSKSGLRAFLRNDGIIVADKKGNARIVIGDLSEDKNILRSGNPSNFNQLGKRA
ncbi:hypothetical protein [Citrobacter koseri]|uniref:hypothetical protein n=1 Tax=Citrobacter koseri TaxID=545 RepID=UPI0023B0A5C8|nr:hypothetical protein [Citrobacter koseri]